MDKEYIPYGPEWVKEMMKWNKKQLIDQLRTVYQILQVERDSKKTVTPVRKGGVK